MPSKRGPLIRRRRIDPKGKVRADAASLQGLLPPASGGVTKRRKHPGSVEIQSHLVKRRGRLRQAAVERGGVLANVAADLPGFAFNVPAPERNRRLLWASISFPWQFWEWDGWAPTNDSSSNLRIEGSVHWEWRLTGNPSVFPTAPIFMSDGRLFEFYTLIVPGGTGFSAGWLAEPYEKTIPWVSSIKGAPSPLAQLLGVRDGDVLRLWITLVFRNAVLNGNDWAGPGAFWGGPNSIDVVYAYNGPPLPFAEPNGGVLIGT
jgi:hypothetical protein